MYNYKLPKPTTINVNKQYIGETMEQKVRRVTETKEPIDAVAERIYTQRKDGVVADYDIRTDRWEIAIEGMDAVTKTELAKREQRLKGMDEKLDQANKDTKKEIGGPEPTQGTDQPTQ